MTVQPASASTPTANAVRGRRSAQPIELSSVTVELHEGSSSMVVKFDRGSDHFSLWVDIDSLKPSNWFFQTPTAGLSRGDAGYFKTRTFTTSAKAHAPVIAEVLAIVRRDNLVEVARIAEAEAERNRAENKRLSKIAWRKSMAGEELYDALTRMLDRFTVKTADGYEDPGGDISFARAAIHKADTYE